MKEETLEEFIKREGYHDGPTQEIWEDGVRLGADWQSKRMYSEEDLRKSFHVGRLYQGRESDTTFEGWFEQFKKK